MDEYSRWPLFNALNVMERVNAFKSYYGALNDVLTVVDSFPDVKVRYVVSATETLPGSEVPIFVKQADLEKAYQIGYIDAIKAIEKNEYQSMIDDYEMFTLRDGF